MFLLVAGQAGIKKLEREIARLVDAIASGGLAGSAAVAQRLKDSERTLARLKAQPVAPKKVPEQLLPDLAKRCRSALNTNDRAYAMTTGPKPDSIDLPHK